MPAVVVVPIGFVSDHMEVIYDLDVVAAKRAAAAGIELVRASTPGIDPEFVSMVRELIEEASIRRGRAERWVRWACARTCARAAASDR